MIPQWIIEKKRDGGELSAEELRFFLEGYGRGDIPDYQMAALAMAVYFKGMTFDEIVTLTDVMMRSGEILDTSRLGMPTADKHSTGGIGDKVSLILAPLVACCGVAVPMISGRGLGLTGGTLDKLESIPGYRTDLDSAGFLDVVAKCGCSIIGQTADLAPIDKKLYALRDVTGTVPSIPLISASIMSKKLAESTDALVLDVKWGRGAFMRELADARRLAKTMVSVGSRMGRRMTAVLTDMNQPLGRSAGNAVEVRECIAALRGEEPNSDLMTVTMELSVQMLLLAGIVVDAVAARTMLRNAISSGRAMTTFREMVVLHGGPSELVDRDDLLPKARIVKAFPAPADGTVLRADAERIGRAVLILGAGRTRVDDRVVHAVGVTGIVKIGEQVARGSPLLTLHANSESVLAEAEELLADAFTVGDGECERQRLIVDVIREGDKP